MRLKCDRASKKVLQRLGKRTEVIGGGGFLGDGVHMGPVPLASQASKKTAGVEELCLRSSVCLRMSIEEMEHFHFEFRKFGSHS